MNININKKSYNPLQISLQGVVLVFVLTLYFQTAFSISTDKIKAADGTWNQLMGVTYYKHKKEYSTFSQTVGKIKYKASLQPILLSTIGSGKVKIKISTFEDFKQQYSSLGTPFEFLKKLTINIEQYLKLLDSNLDSITYEIILVPEGYDISYESKKIPVSKNIKLTFVKMFYFDDDEYVSKSVETSLADFLPHELSHLIVRSQFVKNIKEIRNELYAHLFGKCVKYETVSNIDNKSIIMEFPKQFFKDPDKDLKKVTKQLKNNSKIKDKSRLANWYSYYYFQAVAKNYTGKNIQSDKIPKFCHKLFSEHNFKHPIEKKPPPWFKDFLEKEE